MRESQRVDWRCTLALTRTLLCLVERVAGGADLGGKNLQNLECQRRVRLHQRGEFRAAEKADPCSGARNCRERVGLVADKSGEAEEGTAPRLYREKWLALMRGHTKRCFALVEDVETHGGIVLLKEDAVGVANDGRRVLTERADQLRVGEKRSGVELHKKPFLGDSGFHRRAPLRERWPYHFIDLEPFSVTHITFQRDEAQFPGRMSDLSHLNRHFLNASLAIEESDLFRYMNGGSFSYPFPHKKWKRMGHGALQHLGALPLRRLD